MEELMVILCLLVCVLWGRGWGMIFFFLTEKGEKGLPCYSKRKRMYL